MGGAGCTCEFELSGAGAGREGGREKEVVSAGSENVEGVDAHLGGSHLIDFVPVDVKDGRGRG